ncbi:unnamed protein product [Lota lota]
MTKGLIPRSPGPDEDGKQRQDGTRAAAARQLIENVIHYVQVTESRGPPPGADDVWQPVLFTPLTDAVRGAFFKPSHVWI